MNSLFSKAIFAVVVMTNLSSHAQSVNTYSKTQDLRSAKASQSASMGGVATGGGDLCEDRIQEIRNDIKSWILAGGGASLRFENGHSVEVYKKEMLAKIASAKIRCVGNGDAGYPVTVEGTPKVCRFDRNSNLDQITCDFKKFQTLSEEKQYVLIHHEYAGLADIERPKGADSDYRVSNQLSASLVNKVVKKLAVKSVKSDVRPIPEDQLEGIKKAVSLAGNTWDCGVRRPGSSHILENDRIHVLWFLPKTQTGTIQEKGGKTYFVFYDNQGGAHPARWVIYATAEGTKLVNLSLTREALEYTNVGTFAAPQFTERWVPYAGSWDILCWKERY